MKTMQAALAAALMAATASAGAQYVIDVQDMNGAWKKADPNAVGLTNLQIATGAAQQQCVDRGIPGEQKARRQCDRQDHRRGDRGNRLRRLAQAGRDPRAQGGRLAPLAHGRPARPSPVPSQ